MKLWTVLSKVYNILGYLQKRSKKRLYKQWIEKAELPPAAMPEGEVVGDKIPEVDKKHMLYIMLGVSLVILCIGLILLIVHSC